MSGGRSSLMATDAPTPRWLVVIGGVVLAVAGSFTAVYEVMITPTRIGSVLLWLSVPLAIAGNIVLPRMGRVILPRSPLLAALPLITWLVTFFTLVSQRREGDVLLPAAPTDLMYAGYATMFGGMLSGAITLGLQGARRGIGNGGAR